MGSIIRDNVYIFGDNYKIEYTEMYAGVGIDYQALVNGSITVAAVHLGGNLLFLSEPYAIPEQNIVAGTSLSGSLYGKVSVLGCKFGFNLEMNRNI